mmetsp:Transcript_10616/g.18327  ORF Transcript_10616/g.18327 Transcript_10616/m.18327 type:complete len:219 (-) Transcript_10616:86-742(-)
MSSSRYSRSARYGESENIPSATLPSRNGAAGTGFCFAAPGSSTHAYHAGHRPMKLKTHAKKGGTVASNGLAMSLARSSESAACARSSFPGAPSATYAIKLAQSAKMPRTRLWPRTPSAKKPLGTSVGFSLNIGSLLLLRTECGTRDRVAERRTPMELEVGVTSPDNEGLNAAPESKACKSLENAFSGSLVCSRSLSLSWTLLPGNCFAVALARRASHA